jgi:hypothetical protein
VIVAKEAGKLLEENEFPYWNKNPRTGQDKWGGYRIQHHIFDPGLTSFWGQSMSSPVVDIQKRINHLATAIMTNIILTMGLKLGYPDGMTLPENILTNEPKTFKIPSGGTGQMPAWLSPPVLNPDTKWALEFLIGQFNEIVGLHAQSQGASPEQRMPFLAIQYVVETDMLKFRPNFDRYGDTECRVGWDAANALRQYQPPWMKAMVGEERALELDAFMNDDFDDYDMVMERESGLPESKAGQIATITELIKDSGGALFDMASPMGKYNVLKAMNSGWGNQMIQKETEAVELAREENRRLLNGEQVAASQYHYHSIHIPTHLSLYNSIEYLTKVKGKLEDSASQHIQQHLQLQVQGIQAQQTMNQSNAPEGQPQTLESQPGQQQPPQERPGAMPGGQPNV